MSSAALLPLVLGITALLAVGQILIVRTDRARRAEGRKPLGGSGPWVVPVVLAVIVVGWLVATWIVNR